MIPAATTAATSYREKTLSRLQGRDPLTVLADTLPALRSATAGLSPDALRKPEKVGKWSVLQAVWHLADHEIVASFRLRLVLAQPEPRLQGYDETLWMASLGYERREMAPALRQFEILRSVNLDLLKGLSPAQFERVGLHDERGPETLRMLAGLTAGHDIVHLAQIERIRKTIGVEA